MTKIWSATFNQTPFEVHQLRMLKDNFSYLIVSDKHALAIDVSDGQLVHEELAKHHLTLDAILLTHHHADHVSGAQYLKDKTNCLVIGPQHESLLNLSQDVVDEEECVVGPFSFKVIATPGHSQDHVAYFFEECLALFSGDALFLSGCGRIFDSSAEAFFDSLQKLKALPSKTLIFCGHDYVERNLAFARSKEPDNEILKRAKHVTFRSLEEEIPLNPFLRVATPEEFGNLREEKNLFDTQWV